MGQNLTLNNGESGELLNGDTFGWYTGTSNGAIKLTLALSDLDRVNHTIKITSTWTWKRSSSSGWC
ncbi:MAG: hypothetical protein IJH65_03180 [Methanobrevibacter sp.]|nr:hypothetical protein [Methanobrevibacter sp.]